MCHHNSPRYVSQDLRNTAKLHAHFITSQIDVRLLNEEYEIARKVNSAVDKLTSRRLDVDGNSIQDLFEDSLIIELSNSIGVSVLIDDQVYKFGKTPSDENIKKLGVYLSKNVDGVQFETFSLSRSFADLNFISEEFPGLNYYSLGSDNDCIIWYREHTIKQIHWAGDPTKSYEINREGLSPRKSFEIFTENVKDCSRVWLQSELNACYNFYNFFQIHLRSVLLSEEKENQRILSEILKETNAELENINWISTHDLQEPLRKIRMMASKLTGDDFKSIPEEAQNWIFRMQHSAERMQSLISDILKYTKAGDHNSVYEKVNLNALFEELNTELKDSFQEKNAIVHIETLPEIKGVPFLLKQLFSNILYNSLKFIDPSRSLVITVRSDYSYLENENSSKSGNYYSIAISDNGIGFDNQYNEKIFKIFAKLAQTGDYTGSGIGLALCRKIMSKHHGFIKAEGIPGVGATFTMYFPK